MQIEGIPSQCSTRHKLISWLVELSLVGSVQLLCPMVEGGKCVWVSQDFTGVPVVFDLAAMRDAMKELGGDPSKINPQVVIVTGNELPISASSFRLAEGKNAQPDREAGKDLCVSLSLKFYRCIRVDMLQTLRPFVLRISVSSLFPDVWLTTNAAITSAVDLNQITKKMLHRPIL